MPLIDRLVALLGARRLVHGRPRMGWLLTEIGPPMVWTNLTGALTLEGYNLVLYLTLLGADDATLAWLPLVAYGGIALHALIVLRRKPGGDAKAACVIDTWWGRFAWLGTVAWPPVAWWLGLSTAWVLGGVFVSILLCQMIQHAGISAFMTWTQAVVPVELRGRFFAWRNIFGFIALLATLQVVGWVWPVAVAGEAGGVADQAAHLPWLMGMFTVVTVVVLLSTFALAWSPEMPPVAADHAPPPPLLTALRGQTAYARLVASGMLGTASAACILPYLPRLLNGVGVDGRFYAQLQGWCIVPAQMAGIVVAGWLLRRIGGARLLFTMHVAGVIGEGACLFLAPVNLLWLTPLSLALSGFGRGMGSVGWGARLQELAPARDVRFPTVCIAAHGVAGVLTALGLMVLVPWLEHQPTATAAPAGTSVAWTVVAIGVVLRALALPFAWPWARGR